MRRMVTSKQIEAINKIKVNNNDILIESLPDASYIQMTEDVINIYNEGTDGVSITSDHDTVIDSGNDLKLIGSNAVVISNTDSKPIATFGEEEASGTVGIVVGDITIGTNADDEPNIHGNNGNLVISDYTNPNANSWISFQNDGDLIIRALHLILDDIPTSDPHVAKALWNDNGVLKISSGN